MPNMYAEKARICPVLTSGSLHYRFATNEVCTTSKFSWFSLERRRDPVRLFLVCIVLILHNHCTLIQFRDSHHFFTAQNSEIVLTNLFFCSPVWWLANYEHKRAYCMKKK